jgi:V8-like Glu-specific endopeptidase
MNAQSRPRGPYPTSAPRRLPRALLATALLAALAPPAFAAPDDEIAKIARAEQALIDADLRSLQGASQEALRGLMGADGASVRVEISYVGRGRMSAAPVIEPNDDGATAPGDGGAIDGFIAFNPASGNEFRIRLARADLQRIGALTARAGLDQPAGPRGDPVPREDGDADLARAKAWSNNIDNRTRLSSLTQGTTTWPWRAIVEHDNRCSGTLIGPRHVVTAGHCIYNVPSASWVTGFQITPGRAGSNWNYGSSLMPSGSFSWYFTPAQWRSTGQRQFDFGILVIADRLGDASGWMGYGYLPESSLQSDTILNRGYPWCNANTNGVPRLDDPGDPGSNVACNDRHLYGDVNACGIGEFAARDGDDQARLFNHSCDASGGHSGSPLYRSGNGGPHVIGVHTFSGCGKDQNDRVCTSADVRPLTATRITPEYRDWISYFRNWKP